RIVRVTFAKARTFRTDPMVVAPDGTPAAAALNPFGKPVRARRQVRIPRWTMTRDARTITIATASLRAIINRSDGGVSFNDATGRTILAEVPKGNRLPPAGVQGGKTPPA